MEQSNYRKNLNELTHTCTTAHTGKQVESQSVQPGMGEVDDILTPWVGQPFKSIVDGFEEMRAIARRAIASHATEKQRADEAERLLKWLLDFGSSEFDASKTIREVLVRSGFPEANEILAICGE